MSNNNIESKSIARPETLPVRNNLKLAYTLSLIIALLMAGASITGILYPEILYPSIDLQMSYVPSDVFNLAVGLPILLISLWLAWRGKLIGLLCWPGALFYVLYIYIPYLVGVPFNLLFLPYLILVTLSACTMIGLVASIDGELVREKLAKTIPARSSIIIIVLAIFIILRQTALIITALANGSPAEMLEIPSWIADFVVAIPLMLVAGIQLWRRRPLGYVTGAAIFLGYGVLALSVVPFLITEARYAAVPVDVGGLVMILAMVALCLIPFGFFVRGCLVK